MAESQQSGAGASGGASGGPTTNRELLQHLEDQGVKEMFAVETLSSCDHLKEVGPLPERGLNCEDPCDDCQNKGENWVCLICYKVYCSRYVNEHMVQHGESAGHPVVLSYADLSVWCYPCEKYINTGNEVLKPANRSAHLSKFGKDL